jgi:hypothetical protein
MEEGEEYSTSVPMLTEQDIRDNAGPAQSSLENAHLKKWVNKHRGSLREDMDATVDAHPTALASEKVDMKRINKKVAHLAKHTVFAAELMRRSAGHTRLCAAIELYDKAGFGELSMKARDMLADFRFLKQWYCKMFVRKARMLFGDKDEFIAVRAASAQQEDLRYEDKVAHRKLHGRSVKSPDPSSSEDEREQDKDIGSLKSAIRMW